MEYKALTYLKSEDINPPEGDGWLRRCGSELRRDVHRSVPVSLNAPPPSPAAALFSGPILLEPLGRS